MDDEDKRRDEEATRAQKKAELQARLDAARARMKKLGSSSPPMSPSPTARTNMPPSPTQGIDSLAASAPPTVPSSYSVPPVPTAVSVPALAVPGPFSAPVAVSAAPATAPPVTLFVPDSGSSASSHPRPPAALCKDSTDDSSNESRPDTRGARLKHYRSNPKSNQTTCDVSGSSSSSDSDDGDQEYVVLVCDRTTQTQNEVGMQTETGNVANQSTKNDPSPSVVSLSATGVGAPTQGLPPDAVQQKILDQQAQLLQHLNTLQQQQWQQAQQFNDFMSKLASIPAGSSPADVTSVAGPAGAGWCCCLAHA
eukprot:gene8756-29_t